MNANASFDEKIDDSGLIISVTRQNSNAILIISYRWPVLFLLLFSIIGIVGNLLVCLAIGTERHLHNRTNWFIFSLALADMLISAFVIPLAIVKEFTGFWILGSILCGFWIFLDVCSCTSSIMHIVVISIDRYLAINDPLNVRSRQEKYQIFLLIILIWLIAIFLSSPMIVLGVINPYNIIINGQCFINNQFFVIYGSVISFVIPLIIVIIMYALTVRRLKKQIKECQTQFAQEQIISSANLVTKPFLRRQLTNNIPLDISLQSKPLSSTELRRQRFQRQQKSFEVSEESLNHTCLHEEKCRIEEKPTTTRGLVRQSSTKFSPHAEYACPKNPFCQLKCTCNHHQLETVPEEQSHANRPHSCEVMDSSVAIQQHPPRPISLPVPVMSHQSSSTASMKPVRRHWHRLTLIPSLASTRPKSSSIRNEQKAVKVLGVVFIIFVIAWFPFCITNLLQGVCKRCSINPNILNGFVWLGYVSASINPLVYTIFSRNFRSKFLTLLKCQCLYRTNRQRQLSYYQSHSHLHGSHIQRTNGFVQNDIRRFNAHREQNQT